MSYMKILDIQRQNMLADSTRKDNPMNTIREFLKGKKTYLTAAVGVLGAVLAWSQGQLDVAGLLAAVWAAAQSCFIRAGVANEIDKAAGK